MSFVAQTWTEATDPYVLAPDTAAAMLRGAPWRRFASFGDSLSAGVSDPTPGYDELGWPARIERVLRIVNPDLAYLNTAVAGSKTRQAIEEQGRQIVDFAPDLLHVNSGANDILRRSPNWDQIREDLRAMYEWAAGTGALLTVFTLGRAYIVPVFSDWTERVARVNDITRELGDEFGAVVVDSWDDPLNDRPNLLSEDRIHFATTGQAVLAALMVKELANRLARS